LSKTGSAFGDQESTTMPTTRRANLRGQIDLYTQQSESWKPEHDEAMACRNLEDVIRLGISIFRGVQRVDQEWSEEVRSGAKSFNKDEAKEVADWYEWWYRPCPKVLGDIAGFEQRGYTVDGATEFRECCRATQLKKLDVDAVLRSVDQLNSGKGRRLSEAMDELRGRNI
jgi:hypothetical protein